MTKFQKTQRDDLIQELSSSLTNPRHIIIMDSFKDLLNCLEDEIIQLKQTLTNENNFILKIISTLSPPNNESPQEHHTRCLKWLEEFKNIK